MCCAKVTNYANECTHNHWQIQAWADQAAPIDQNGAGLHAAVTNHRYTHAQQKPDKTLNTSSSVSRLSETVFGQFRWL